MAIDVVVNHLAANVGKEVAVVSTGSLMEWDRAVYCLEQMNPAVQFAQSRTGPDEKFPNRPVFLITVTFVNDDVRRKLKNALYRCSPELQETNPEENAQAT